MESCKCLFTIDAYKKIIICFDSLWYSYTRLACFQCAGHWPSFRGKIQKYRRGKYFFYLECRNVEFAKRMFYCLMCNIYIYICITCELDASVQALQISMYIVRATGGSDIERFRSQSVKVSFSEINLTRIFKNF